MRTVDSLSNKALKPNPAIIARTLADLPKAAQPSSQPKTACDSCRLNNLCLSRSLNSEGRKALNDITVFRRPLKRKQHLYRQGDKFESVYFVRSGFLKSYVTNEEGDELAVSFVFPGEMVGLDGLHANAHSSSVSALEDTFLCEIPFKALEKLFLTQPLVQKHFMELQSRQIVQEQAMTILRGQKTAAAQLEAFLDNLSSRYARIKLSSTSFRLPMTRKEIAGCLGLTIETVSRLFSKFQEENKLVINGREVMLKSAAMN